MKTWLWGGVITPDQKRGCPETELGKKYEGLKYSISPLKQVLETIMVFQKPIKNKSVIDDVFAYEEGDKEISVSAWNIDYGRVPTSDKVINGGGELGKNGVYGNLERDKTTYNEVSGRFPSQMLIDEECARRLDKQSGELTSGARKSSYPRRGTNPNKTYGKFNEIMMDDAEKNSGGCSRILHHIGYHDEELDLVIYSPKVSSFERELGCNSFNKVAKNTHPTLKPIKLNYQIAKLLKTPNKQKIFFPFVGTGSEVIGFIQAGFNKKHFKCCEINKEYIDIAKVRIKAWNNLNINTLTAKQKKELRK